ncbi:MAG: fatty acid desaturase [Planctomycetia bacterium]|nr:fatty acid desaturase [Planctomycetia bacterium]MBL6914969.1 fatty acid desaturase [Planctomycetota bacterium]
MSSTDLQETPTTDPSQKDGPIIWSNTLFLSLSPIITLFLLPTYIYYQGHHWALTVTAVLMWFFAGLGITVGYHRLFAHRSYEAHPIWKFLALVAGASALQNSALVWSASHRRHHKHTDHGEDPYDATRGFWWSHMRWIFHANERAEDFSNVPDLKADPLVMWQKKYYWAIAFTVDVLIPLGLGFLIGRPIGMLLFAGLARVVFTHQATFCINSLCHIIGTQPWSKKDTSKDSWICALITFGEGYHNFHHTFPADYRNGLKWYHFDPAKWLIWGGNKLGLTTNLKRTEAPVRWKKRLERQMDKYQESIVQTIPEAHSEWSIRVESACLRVEETLNIWSDKLREYRRAVKQGEVTESLLLSVKESRKAWKHSWREFMDLRKTMPIPA